MLVMIGGAGCSYVSPVRVVGGSRYYLLEPTVLDENFRKNKEKITDYDIVTFTKEVKTVLRERYNNARLARTGGGAIQVLTSGISAFLMGINGGSAVTAATILSGTSSIIPELSNVVEAKDRAEAYADGLKSVEIAEGVYVKSIADGGEGKISAAELTPAAATLYDTVLAAIHVVEARLSALLPSTDELRKARSEFERIEVVPAVVSLKSGETATPRVVRGGPVTAASANDNIAKVTADGASGVKIDADKAAVCRWTTVTLGNVSGGRGQVTVRVENDPSFSVSPNNLKLQVKAATKAGSSVPVSGQGCPIKNAKSDDDGIATIDPAIPAGGSPTATIKPVSKGKTTIHLENQTGRLAEVAVEVEEVP